MSPYKNSIVPSYNGNITFFSVSFLPRISTVLMSYEVVRRVGCVIELIAVKELTVVFVNVFILKLDFLDPALRTSERTLRRFFKKVKYTIFSPL